MLKDLDSNFARCCHLIYSLIQQLNALIPKLQEQSEVQSQTDSTEVLCHSLYDRFVRDTFSHLCRCFITVKLGT